MNTKRITWVVLGLFILGVVGLEAQTEKRTFSSYFSTMHKEQLKVAKANKFTKEEVAAIDKAMATAGRNINRALKAAPGETHQYLVDKIKGEFRTLDRQLGRALAGEKLTAFRKVTNQHKNKILNNLQMQYLNSQGVKRTNIRAGLRAGIRASLIRGFGGDDPGW